LDRLRIWQPEIVGKSLYQACGCSFGQTSAGMGIKQHAITIAMSCTAGQVGDCIFDGIMQMTVGLSGPGVLLISNHAFAL
jgi:hypothetical protein